MGKLLAWIALFVVIYLGMRLAVILQRKSKGIARRGKQEDAAKGAGSGRVADPEGPGEPMQPCAHCGVYVPVSEMLRAGERRYCSPEHRDADR